MSEQLYKGTHLGQNSNNQINSAVLMNEHVQKDTPMHDDNVLLVSHDFNKDTAVQAMQLNVP
jgi:hypothetical protein